MQKLSIPNYTVEELEALLYSNPDYIVGFRLIVISKFNFINFSQY